MGQQSTTATGGFNGPIGSMPLVDLLQFWSLNQFSGLVTVASQGRAGRIYFVQGEIVHAEAEGATGEEALRVLLGWRDGSFEPIPNTTTLERTITKRLSHLLLDVHRELDERRRDGAPPPQAGAPGGPARTVPAAVQPAGPTLLDQIKALPGVTGMVRFGEDGRPTGPGGHEAEALAAKGLYLALNHAAAVGEAFGLHGLSMAALRGAGDSFVLVHSRASYLAVRVAEGTAVEPVAAQMRALLTRPAGR